jgi:general stress protein 26
MKEMKILETVKHIALATVNDDGSPHNTPLFYAVNEELKKIYFASRAESLHTINFVRDGRAFAALYDSNEFNGGLYLTITNGRKVYDDDMKEAVEVYRKQLDKWDNTALKDDFYLIEGGYNLYVGDIKKLRPIKRTVIL